MTEATTMRLEDWLDDLCVRFIINLPREELESVERICFQVEEAQWFYEDFIRPLDPHLPSMNLRQFALRIFQHCPLMSEWSHDHHLAAFSEFLAYKTRVPVRGAILLNEAMDEVVLVKGWKKGAHWSFPRGKINKDEKDLDCAVREVHEETGFDLKIAGLVHDEKALKYIEIPMREQNMRLYVVRGVPMDTHFEPRTRKEISKIQWYKLSELPTVKKSKQAPLDNQNANGNANKFYMVAPFLGPLRKWIVQQRKLDVAKEPTLGTANFAQEEDVSEGVEPSDLLGRHANERPVPSDLPEVSTPLPHQEDASARMKRLLNIGTGSHSPIRASDSSNADALLNMLRKGSEDLGSQAPMSDRPAGISSHQGSGPPQAFPQSFHWQTNAPPPRHPGPLQPSPFGPQHGQPSPAQLQKTGFPANVFNQPPRPESVNRPSHLQQSRQYQAASMHQPQLRYQPHYPQPPMQNIPRPPVSLQQQFAGAQAPSFGSAQPSVQKKQTPAPYQLTGDPQFAQGSRFPNAELLSGPPANKLPLPKLTNHSRALLDVFKNDNTAKRQEPPARELPSQPVTQNPPEHDEKSQHQNNLLKLLQQQQQQQQPAPSASTPTTTTTMGVPQRHVELATAPSPLTDAPKPEPVKILKRDGVVSPKSKPHDTAPKFNEATLSGPLNLPNFEAAKANRRKQAVQSANTIQKEARKDKPANITILSRPDQAKKDNSAYGTVAETAPVSAPPTQTSPPRQNVKLADFAKPSKPKILRRPEKGDLDAFLPTHTVAVSAFSKPEDGEVESEQKEEPKQVNYNRKPSQTAAQKEALLSLFGKKSGGPTTSVPCSPEGQQQKPAVSPPSVSPARSNVISPLPSGSPPAPAPGATSQPPPPPAVKATSPVTSSEPASKDRGKMTSPGDKAFLLDYLAGVAKGNR